MSSFAHLCTAWLAPLGACSLAPPLQAPSLATPQSHTLPRTFRSRRVSFLLWSLCFRLVRHRPRDPDTPIVATHSAPSASHARSVFRLIDPASPPTLGPPVLHSFPVLSPCVLSILAAQLLQRPSWLPTVLMLTLRFIPLRYTLRPSLQTFTPTQPRPSHSLKLEQRLSSRRHILPPSDAAAPEPSTSTPIQASVQGPPRSREDLPEHPPSPLLLSSPRVPRLTSTSRISPLLARSPSHRVCPSSPSNLRRRQHQEPTPALLASLSPPRNQPPPK